MSTEVNDKLENLKKELNIVEEKNPVSGKTVLLQDKGLDYRAKVVGIISLVNSHCTMPTIANTLNLTYSGLKRIFEQNERLPRPFDFNNWTKEKAIESGQFEKDNEKKLKKGRNEDE